MNETETNDHVNETDLITVAEAAEIAAKNKNTIYNFIKSGMLNRHEHLGMMLVSRKEVEKLPVRLYKRRHPLRGPEPSQSMIETLRRPDIKDAIRNPSLIAKCSSEGDVRLIDEQAANKMKGGGVFTVAVIPCEDADVAFLKATIAIMRD